MKIFLILLIIFFTTGSNADNIGRGELQLQNNIVGYFMYYIRLKGQQNPSAFYVTEDGANAQHWICPTGRCQSHNVGQGVRKCEIKYEKKCKLFARKRVVVWKNGTNPGKGKESTFNSKASDNQFISKLTDLGFLGGQKRKNIKKSADDQDSLTKEDINSLKKLKELLDQDILTQEEFNKAKKKILN